MRIDNSQVGQPEPQKNTSSVRGISSSSRSSPRASVGGASSDQVQLSTLSQLLQTGNAARSEQIAKLSALVSTGQYNPSAQAVSRSLVQETLARRQAGQTE